MRGLPILGGYGRHGVAGGAEIGSIGLMQRHVAAKGDRESPGTHRQQRNDESF